MRILPTVAATRRAGVACAALAFLPACASIATRPTELLPMVEIEVNNTPATVDDYITWAPTPARIRIANASQVNAAYTVVLSNLDPNGTVGQIKFATSATTWDPVNPRRLTLTLPASGAWVPFVIAGVWGQASKRDKDAVIEATEDRTDGVVLGRKALMVRIRKDANALTEDERKRFLQALIKLNAQMSNYDQFRAIHAVAVGQAHSNLAAGHQAHAFLPWHRALILRFERELQAIDPSVALPYWKFDVPAPAVFTPDFMGVNTTSPGWVSFSSSNPLSAWVTPNMAAGVHRAPSFGPFAAPPGVLNEATTLALGTAYGAFLSMQTNPHAQSHIQLGSWQMGFQHAVRDPLFFLLHANVDRLWAKWQYHYTRFMPTQVATYTLQGNAPPSPCAPLGHHVQDQMWPWNGATFATDGCRPTTAPGGAFPQTATALLSIPAQPRPFDMIDYRQGGLNGSGSGFAYDDVPF